MWVQLAGANPNTQDYAGMCLRFTQSVFSAPVKYRSAWDAWNATQFKHESRDIPGGVTLPLWFSHYGTYGSPPSYENWGHVVSRFDDGRLLSSPGSGYGQAWFNSIEEVERYFNATYVGWSEDLNGLRIIEEDNPSESSEEVKQISFNGRRYLIGLGTISSIPQGENAGDLVAGQPLELGSDVNFMNRICRANGVPDWAWSQVADGSGQAGNDKSWNAATGLYQTVQGPSYHTPTVDMDAIKQAIKDAVSGVELNVDAIAEAIADNIEVTCDCGCGIPIPEPVDDVTTKADILEAIETNYPEDK